MRFKYGTGAVLVRYRCSAGMVQVRCGAGTVRVRFVNFLLAPTVHVQVVQMLNYLMGVVPPSLLKTTTLEIEGT